MGLSVKGIELLSVRGALKIIKPLFSLSFKDKENED